MLKLKRTRQHTAKIWAPADLLRFGDGEIHFLYWFIQGSIMNPSTRWKLRHSWGMCDRHSFAFIAIEAAFRDFFLHGQAVLYQDLMERAVAAFKAPTPFYAYKIAGRLRESESCLLCEIGYGPDSKALYHPKYIDEGNDLRPIRSFADETEPLWRAKVCGRCAENDTPLLCRIHLRESLHSGNCDLPEQRAYVQDIFKRISRYAHSFVWGYHGTDTMEDRAALIEAIGWLNGWRVWLMLCDRNL
jgi:hypothetical protein